MTQITLLDGSVGQEIVKRAGKSPTPLWSTSVMIDQPGVVRDVHKDYFDVGATVATANTYAIHVDRLVKAGLEDQHLALLDRAMSEAIEARDANGGGKIAIGIGPLGASYRPDIQTPLDEAAAAFHAIVQHLDDRADVFLIETVSAVDHARGALEGTKNATKPVWLSLSVNDDDGSKLRSGEDLADILPLVAEYNPDAVLLNCSRPEAMEAGLDVLKTAGKPFGAYGNGFTHIDAAFLQDSPTVDALSARSDLGPQDYAKFAMGWIDQGATIVGGCCEVGPEHIAELASQIRAAGHEIV